MKIKFKEFEAIRWYDNGKLSPREKSSIEPDKNPELKFIAFGRKSLESSGDHNVYLFIYDTAVKLELQSNTIVRFILLDGFIHHSDDYHILSQYEVEKYVYSNEKRIRILNGVHSDLYYWEDLPQEIKDQL